MPPGIAVPGLRQTLWAAAPCGWPTPCAAPGREIVHVHMPGGEAPASRGALQRAWKLTYTTRRDDKVAAVQKSARTRL